MYQKVQQHVNMHFFLRPKPAINCPDEMLYKLEISSHDNKKSHKRFAMTNLKNVLRCSWFFVDAAKMDSRWKEKKNGL